MVRIFPVLVSVLLLTVGSAAAAPSAGDFPSLYDSRDAGLQRDLESVLARAGLSRAAADGRLGLAVVDITDLDNPRVAAVNGDEMFYAASLPKIAILLGAIVQVERGSLAMTDDLRDSLTQMIRFSSNREATRVYHMVGASDIAEILASPEYRLYDTEHNGGLWVGKEYGRGQAWRRDPLHNLSHGATALQAARFYYLLETGQLASPGNTAVMKEVLSEPGIEHKFVRGLKASHPDARIYRKSGTWRHWHADSAIVEHEGYRYIVVGLVEDSRGGQWLSKLAAPIDAIIAAHHQGAPKLPKKVAVAPASPRS